MEFERELRAYLEALERETTERSPVLRRVDEQELHRHLILRLRELDDAGEALRPVAAEPDPKRRIDTARQGVARVLDFVDGMVQMSELITEPAMRCEIGAVVDQAIAWVDVARRVERRSFGASVEILAPRGRFARAISNVIGNALQATNEDQPVRVSLSRSAGGIRVIVDDAGPGVPVELRARIFLEGVTLRRDGTGSGFGLAFARRVVEGALHGRVWCEDSDLGGARFVIEVPEASPE